MQKIFLDNASTSPIREEVIETMIAVMREQYGNPSSTHSYGRSAKNIVETSRKTIAKHLNCTSQEVIFLSNGTEGTNWILRELVENHKVERIITSSIEHHATLYTVKQLQTKFGIEVVYLPILKNGELDYNFYASQFPSNKKTLVTLMHVNNEIGTELDVEKIGKICNENMAYFHCDMVQSFGKTEIDVLKMHVDFMVASAHKFHGPKGIGFAYINKKHLLKPFTYGGEQEKGLRAGTEAVHQIAGLARATELAYEFLHEERKYIADLKEYCTKKLKENFTDCTINGENTFYNIINVTLPFSEEKTAMILFNLDMKGIAVSRGSACQSGSLKPSHVLAAFQTDDLLKKPSLRISFSHYNTKEEIDFLIENLKLV
jgi:cysteine desulfurase